MSSEYEILAPAPSATIESLTGVGYSLKTAIADLVDNSITAMAKNIWLDFYSKKWRGIINALRVEWSMFLVWILASFSLLSVLKCLFLFFVSIPSVSCL